MTMKYEEIANEILSGEFCNDTVMSEEKDVVMVFSQDSIVYIDNNLTLNDYYGNKLSVRDALQIKEDDENELNSILKSYNDSNTNIISLYYDAVALYHEMRLVFNTDAFKSVYLTTDNYELSNIIYTLLDIYTNTLIAMCADENTNDTIYEYIVNHIK